MVSEVGPSSSGSDCFGSGFCGVVGMRGVARVGVMLSNGLIPMLGIGLRGLGKNGSTPCFREGIAIPMALGGGMLDPVPDTLSVDPSVVSVVVPSVVVVVRMSEPFWARTPRSGNLSLGCTSGGREAGVWSIVGSRAGNSMPGIGPGFVASIGN